MVSFRNMMMDRMHIYSGWSVDEEYISHLATQTARWCADMKKDVMLPRSDRGFHKIFAIFRGKIRQKTPLLHMFEG